jgi:hypothetical protein
MEKYFKPTLEDIRVGYELEYHNWSIDEAGESELNYDWWEATILKPDNVETFMKYGIKGGVRVPFLTKEKLQEEGWTFLDDTDSTEYFENRFSVYKDKYVVAFFKTDGILCVTERETDGILDTYILYRGLCPSINEFRMILKFLNIK